MTSRMCCICMSKDEDLKSLNWESNGRKLCTKLEIVAPEYKWTEIFSICTKCIIQLDNAYYFKQLCSASDSYRKKFSDDSTASLAEDNNTALNIIVKTENLSSNRGDETDTAEVDSTFSGFDDTSIPRHQSEDNITDSGEVNWSNCESKLNSKNNLRCHISKKHRNKRQNLKIHQEEDHTKKLDTKFQCELCGQYFALLKNIVDHCILVHGVRKEDIKPYHCNQCDNKFASSSSLIQHKKYHNSERTFVCTTCGKSFKTARDLNGHEKHHSNNRKYSCNKCDKKFKTSQNLKTHIYVIHTDPIQWKYSCPVCSKRFAMKTNCNEHIKRHQGKKDFVCDICKKSFVSNHELKKHVKLHSNIASFKCIYCQKHYRDKKSLGPHLSKMHRIKVEKTK